MTKQWWIILAIVAVVVWGVLTWPVSHDDGELCGYSTDGLDYYAMRWDAVREECVTQYEERLTLEQVKAMR